MTALAQAFVPLKSPREHLSLDGDWDFRHEADAAWRSARVPGPWQAQFPELALSFGRATYRRRFDLPDAWTEREVALRFQAVCEIARVRVNGREVAYHEGGYLPFEAVIPAELLRPTNEVEVEVILPDGSRGGGVPDFAEIPHGKQSWYGPQGGIWQSVSLEARNPAHIRSIRLDPLWPEGRLDIRATLARPVRGTLSLEVRDGAGALVLAETVDVGGEAFRHALALDRPEPWSPERPTLYTLHATLSVDGVATDTVSETFGFRHIEAKDGFLHLNGRPLYLRGALDQDYYPDGSVTAPSLHLLEDQLRKAKAMGLNCLRVHIKVPDPRYYEVADRLGMLVWTEIPNVETWTPDSAARLRATLEGMLARDRNHPSIIIWTLINEDWGTRLRESAEQRAWLGALYDWLKAEDPLRLVVDNSACFPNVHVKTDIDDYHYYRSVLDRREEWQALTNEFAARPAWSFSREKEAVRTGKEPLIVSEFGVWGLPDPALLRGDDGRDPWWMPIGAVWGEGAAVPQGIEVRFSEVGLDTVFGSLGNFVEAAQWHQFHNLKAEIEVLRAAQPIGGYVVTELTDVHWEGNGLMDMSRNPRVFAEALAHVNTDLVIVPGLAHPAVRSGRTLHLDLTVATGGAELPSGARLAWRLDGEGGEAALPAGGPMSVVRLALALRAPTVSEARTEEILLTVLGPDGATLSQAVQPLSLFPKHDGALRPVNFATDHESLAERLSMLGHREVAASEAEVFVTDLLDAARIEAIHSGARILQVVSHGQRRLRSDEPARDGPMSMAIEDPAGGFRSGPYFSFPGYGLHARHGTLWRGDWLGNFAWLRRDAAFAGIPGGPMLDLAFSCVIPRQVLTGLRSWEFRGRVHAGVVVGWIHKPAAFVIEKRLGRGKVVLSTFRLLEDAADADPVATALWQGLLDVTTAA